MILLQAPKLHEASNNFKHRKIHCRLHKLQYWPVQWKPIANSDELVKFGVLIKFGEPHACMSFHSNSDVT